MSRFYCGDVVWLSGQSTVFLRGIVMEADFLLNSETGKLLYEFVKSASVIDYHNSESKKCQTKKRNRDICGKGRLLWFLKIK